jgi:hypothetical protein
MNPFIEIDSVKNPFLSESEEEKSPPKLPPRPSSSTLLAERVSPSNDNTAPGPPLPNRPHMQKLSSYASEPNLRPERPLLHMTSVDRLVALSVKEQVYHPETSKSTRNLPKASGHIIHKGLVKCWSLSSTSIVTGSTNIRSYNIYTGENTKTIPLGELRPQSLEFVPTWPYQENDVLWVGCEKGEILEISINQARIISKRGLHSASVSHILRFKAMHLITLDEQGALKIWTEVDSNGLLNLHARPRGLRIHSRLGQSVCTVTFFLNF